MTVMHRVGDTDYRVMAKWLRDLADGIEGGKTVVLKEAFTSVPQKDGTEYVFSTIHVVKFP